jgi:hypothetical protein
MKWALQMSAESSLAKVIRVNIEFDQTGLFYATSPDLKGLLVAKSTIKDLETAIPQAITNLYLATGESVVVIPANDMDGERPIKTWVGLPSSVVQCLEIA